MKDPNETGPETRKQTRPVTAFDLLSRRAFVQGAGGALALLLAGREVRAALPQVGASLLPSPALFVGQASATAAATPAGALQLPLWGDAAGWDRPEYYETFQAGRRLRANRTVQSADVNGDGQDELIIRGPAGILVCRFDPATGQWLDMPSGPALSGTIWNLPQHYLNIQTADIDGDGRAELIARTPAGVVAWKYDINSSSPTYQTWVSLPDGPPWKDGYGWDRPPYYPTIQCADIDGDGQAELLGRGTDGDPSGAGMQCWKYDATVQQWEQMPGLTAVTDQQGWTKPEYYLTLQCADIDGDGQQEVIGRGIDGVLAWKYDKASKGWQQTSALEAFGDSAGMNKPQYYLTIQATRINVFAPGERHSVIGRNRDGIYVYEYSSGNNSWNPPTYSGAHPPWSDAAGWDKPEHYETIQCADIDGDGLEELIGRGPNGIEAWKYDFSQGIYVQMPDGPAWSDAAGWNQVQYYSTIQSARTLKPGDTGYTGDGTHTQAVLLGRDSLGIKTWRYDVGASQWKQTSTPYPQFAGNQLVAYNHITTALNIQETGDYGIRGRYNDLAANINEWTNDLLGMGPNPVSPPANVPAADWNVVKRQIVNELTWVRSVNDWFTTLTADQITQTFLGENVTLYTVGNYLDYDATSGSSISVLGILALVFGGIAAVLGFPELEAGAAAAVAGTIGTAFSAGASAMPGGGLHGFQANYSQLQTQLSNSYNAAIAASGQIPSQITGGLNGTTYTPGDYGLLAAVGQMIASTIWDWPSGDTNLVITSQRAYATSVFQTIFKDFEAKADPSKVWVEWYATGQPSQVGAPEDFPYQYMYAAHPPFGGPFYWLETGNPPTGYPDLDTLAALFDPVKDADVFPLAVPLADFYLAQNGWPKLPSVNVDSGQVVRAAGPAPGPPALEADVRVEVALSRDAVTGTMVAAITLSNYGHTAATNVTLFTAPLSGAVPLASPPTRHTRLAPGQAKTVYLHYGALPAGRRVVLKVAGEHLDGTFGGSFRLTTP